MRGYGDTGTSMDNFRETNGTETRKMEKSCEVLKQNIRKATPVLTMKREKRGNRKMER
jgi:hypothetical protein